MLTIAKLFEFAAAHQLKGLPEDHPCSRMHGHNYTVEVELEAHTTDEVGFVFDYRAMDVFKREVDAKFDHRTLNDVVPFNPTAENLARYFWVIADRLLAPTPGTPFRISAVRVRETPKTVAEYRPA